MQLLLGQASQFGAAVSHLRYEFGSASQMTRSLLLARTMLLISRLMK